MVCKWDLYIKMLDIILVSVINLGLILGLLLDTHLYYNFTIYQLVWFELHRNRIYQIDYVRTLSLDQCIDRTCLWSLSINHATLTFYDLNYYIYININIWSRYMIKIYICMYIYIETFDHTIKSSYIKIRRRY